MIVFEQRGAAVIFNLLSSSTGTGAFLLPSNICPIIPITFLKTGRTFEFVDITEDDFCMNRDVICQKIKNNPGHYDGIIFVRTYGYCDNQEDFFLFLKELNDKLLIIDDRCLCMPEDENETLVDVVLYSTGKAKPVDVGFGGFAYVKDNIPYKRNILAFSKRDEKDIVEKYKMVLKTRKKFNCQESDWLNTSLPPIDFDAYQDRIKEKKERITDLRKNINSIYADGLPKEI